MKERVEWDLGRTARDVAHRSWAAFILTAVDLGIGIAQFDCNVALQLILEAHSLHTRQGFHHS